MWCSTDKISLSINHQDTEKKKKSQKLLFNYAGMMDKKYRTISIVGELGGKDKNLQPAGACTRSLQVNQTLRAGF